MRAKRSLGQHFLVGSHYPQRILSSVSPAKGETIIEIGPGHGALTQGLIESGAGIIAIEKDRDLIFALQKRFSEYENFKLVEADALKVDFCSLAGSGVKCRVVANLPYNVSTPILQHLLEHRKCLIDMTLMLQREVVERITASPGGKEYGFLSILVQFYCEAKHLFDVPPGAFRPAPKVHSSIVRLKVRPGPYTEVIDELYFVEVVKVLFSHRRKTILNNLRSGFGRLGLVETDELLGVLDSTDIDLRRRAETLSIDEAALLADCLFEEIGSF